MNKALDWLKCKIQQKIDFYSGSDEEWQDGKVLAYTDCMSLLEQVEKPEISGSMAKYIEECRKEGCSLADAYMGLDTTLQLATYVPEYVDEILVNSEVFATAWIMGYTVREENNG